MTGGFVVPEAVADALISEAVDTFLIGIGTTHTDAPPALAGQSTAPLSDLHAENTLRSAFGRRPDPAVLAAVDEYHQHAHAEHAALLADVPRGGLAEAMLAHHAPDEHDLCRGCDVDGYEGEQPHWPCSSYRLVAERYERTFADGPYGTRMGRAR